MKHSQHWYFDKCCSNSILAGLVQWRSESIEKYSSSGGKREASKLEESGQADKKGFTQLKKYLWNKSHHFYKRHLIEIRFTLLMKEKNLQKEVYLSLYFVQCSEAGQRGGGWWWCGELDVFFWPNRPGRSCRGGIQTSSLMRYVRVCNTSKVWLKVDF